MAWKKPPLHAGFGMNSLERYDSRHDRLDFGLLLLFVFILTLPFWIHLRNRPAANDADALQSLAFARIFVDAIWNHQQFPIWNPYFGGGVPWAGMVWNPGLTPLSLILNAQAQWGVEDGSI